ncbi:MAG: pyridoxamine kinase [Ruminococcus sp.]|nr:pyridoxamine kinase [Ruminococcus sp.]
MKRTVTIQDISCFGKCSLTVALPVISAMGIETAVIPTAVLSTHTGGFTGYTFRDLTGDIPEISRHWKSLDIKFDSVYTGYLGSAEQIEIVSKFFDDFRTENNFIVVDPVLGDNGRFYAGFNEDFAGKMAGLCSKADYIIPNMTEACFMLKIPYTESYDRTYIEDILRKLAGLGCKIPVLTGVYFNDREQGAVAYDSGKDTFCYSFGEHISRSVHGTGDIFASVFTGAVTLGKDVQTALDIAVNYTVECIKATIPHFDEMWYGSCFELCIGKLIDMIK